MAVMRCPARATLSIALVVTALAAACNAPDVPRARRQQMPRPLSDPGTGSAAGGATGIESMGRTPAVAAAQAPEERPLVVFLGDSLTAGYGLSAEEAFPAHVERELGARGLPVRVLNAGVSGDTSAGGRERLAWFLDQRPAIVVVALGANDGLRGQPVAATEANLRDIVERSQAAGARVVLAGIRIPPNYGPDYRRGFEAIYPRLAAEYGVALIPFLLEGVAADPALNLPDGIHPNADGQKIVAATVAAALEPIVADLAADPGRAAP
jgi:acyl-CoA thioesterase I